VVLAGGLGRRMGGADKGLIEYQGRPLIEWALAALASQVDEIFISANRNLDRYAAYGYRVLPDTLPDFPGPLAGVLAALEAVDTGWLLVVPCDTPHLPADLASRLLQAAQREKPAGANLTVTSSNPATWNSLATDYTTWAGVEATGKTYDELRFG
jgi:molybdopterin-guanine dinucleotide biosynthesis protein A